MEHCEACERMRQNMEGNMLAVIRQRNEARDRCDKMADIAQVAVLEKGILAESLRNLLNATSVIGVGGHPTLGESMGIDYAQDDARGALEIVNG